VTFSGAALQEVACDTAEALADVTDGYPFTDVLRVFKVAGRVFLIVTDDPDEQIITVKAEPPRGGALVREYDSIQPGRYLDKHHWVSVGEGPGITAALIRDLVRASYDLVVDGLPRRDQDRIHHTDNPA
jgi:predicted DNA-binding protein (MmcQ/YjbR family)